MAKIGHRRPAGVGECNALKRNLVVVTRQNVKMHMRIDHHQHQVVDLLIAKARHGGLDIAGDLCQFAMRATVQITKGLRRPMCQQDHRPQRRLLWPRLYTPPLIIPDQRVLTAETGKSGVSFWHFGAFHGYSPCRP